MKIFQLVSCLVLAAGPVAAGAAAPTPSREMQLPVTELRKSFEPYASYCDRYPGHCNLSGSHIVELNSDTSRLLRKENANANSAVSDASDIELYGREEYWAFPSQGAGDCEDIALFKR